MYIENLKTAVTEWLNDETIDEWYFESFRDNNVNTLSPDQAFSHINETTDVLIDQIDESILIELAETILCLARVSCTTEVPSSILSNKSELEAAFTGKCDYAQRKLLEIFSYYRLK